MIKLILVVFCALTYAYVFSEHCKQQSDCDHINPITDCYGHSHVICNGGWCECSHGAGQNCTEKSTCPDCDHHDHSHHGHHVLHKKHCINGECHCTTAHGHHN